MSEPQEKDTTPQDIALRSIHQYHVPDVLKAITQVRAKIAKEGIAKDRKNAQQGYNFRGVDDIYNALSPLLAEAGLNILPNVLDRSVTERESAKGGALFYVVLKVEYCFCSDKDGSERKIVIYGEAMDSGDKATNKALSAAFKYACMQTFSIPTEGDHDADAVTHEVKHETPQLDRATIIRLEEAPTLPHLAAVWDSLPKPVQKYYASIKDRKKADLIRADQMKNRMGVAHEESEGSN